ncbi:DUF4352 domain-containing protein [Nocardiopsis dassonvillei]|uniref:DUF4352 domain-containing protein n=1 Tax=Nocardiopsis dassonvillei TaxID=2014 RepID=UPI00200EAC73|nr:DUF4352 domain-containing protein [Nocardiopsis dassonvillei]MCK9871234.1 DUF4352 domain-containing protein [Nocardiopsis dassonvillei]
MRHTSMGNRGRHPPPSRGPGSVVRALAAPVAVLLAGAGCVATVVSLERAPLPEARLVLEQSEPEPGTAQEPATPGPSAPDPGPPDPTAPEPAPPDPTAPDPSPEQEEPPGSGAEPDPQPVPPESYNGASAVFDTFLVEVEAAYTDTSVTDGMGASAVAPPDSEYHVYRLDVTNQGSSPAVFDSYGTIGVTTEGLEYANDVDAEIVVAWDYFWDEINPGESVTTHILFLAPTGTEFAEVHIGGRGLLEPD